MKVSLKEIYLDNAATTKVSSEAMEAAINAMGENYGNPSSLHSKGLSAQLSVEEAKSKVAALMGCDAERIIFTSGGTEANNTAIFGTASAHKKRGKKIITTAVEHSSVLAPIKALEEQGFEVVVINPDSSGNITAEELAKHVDLNTILISIMAVNSETGTIFPLKEMVKAAKAKNPKVIFHTDAVQAFGKLPITPAKWDIDLMTVSGHKIYAPKGIGALYIKKGVRILPLIWGGSQQGKIRPGTESVPLICALGKAAEISTKEHLKNYEYVKSLWEYASEKAENTEGIVINQSIMGSPYIFNISAPGYRSEIMLHSLAEKGIYISSGSACSKGAPSHVLKALGLPSANIDSALRISFSRESSKEDIDALFEVIAHSMQRLIKSR